MKFSVFADFHQHAAFKKGTMEDLLFIQKRAEENNCDFIIHAGDLCHIPTKCLELIEKYNSFHIPSYHSLGNHDTDGTSYEETLKLFNMPAGHYYFDCKGYRMMVCDTNYIYYEGQYIHYDLGNYFKYPDFREYVSEEELEWMRDTIDSSPYPCILISHASFERPDGCPNGDAVRAIIDAANEKRPHSVLMCINGHHHADYVRILNNVCYFDLNSTNYHWFCEPYDHDKYPEEETKRYWHMNHVIMYNDPVHAVITLDGTNIKCEGMKSTYYMGLDRVALGYPPFDTMFRPTPPEVQSFNITL